MVLYGKFVFSVKEDGALLLHTCCPFLATWRGEAVPTGWLGWTLSDTLRTQQWTRCFRDIPTHCPFLGPSAVWPCVFTHAVSDTMLHIVSAPFHLPVFLVYSRLQFPRASLWLLPKSEDCFTPTCLYCPLGHDWLPLHILSSLTYHTHRERDGWHRSLTPSTRRPAPPPDSMTHRHRQLPDLLLTSAPPPPKPQASCLPALQRQSSRSPNAFLFLRSLPAQAPLGL